MDPSACGSLCRRRLPRDRLQDDHSERGPGSQTAGFFGRFSVDACHSERRRVAMIRVRTGVWRRPRNPAEARWRPAFRLHAEATRAPRRAACAHRCSARRTACGASAGHTARPASTAEAHAARRGRGSRDGGEGRRVSLWPRLDSSGARRDSAWASVAVHRAPLGMTAPSAVQEARRLAFGLRSIQECTAGCGIWYWVTPDRTRGSGSAGSRMGMSQSRSSARSFHRELEVGHSYLIGPRNRMVGPEHR